MPNVRDCLSRLLKRFSNPQKITCAIVHEKEHLTSDSGRVSRFLNYYDKFDSDWFEVAVKLVFMHGLDSVVNRVYSLEISQTRQRQHRYGKLGLHESTSLGFSVLLRTEKGIQ